MLCRSARAAVRRRCIATLPARAREPASLAPYDFRQAEAKWSAAWRAHGHAKPASPWMKEKRYVLCMFPYPSGRLHLGHVRVYAIGDVIARVHRMQGYDVLHPMGFDAFGLPAENAARERNIPAAEWTDANIARMRSQMHVLGFSFDWDVAVETHKPEYFKFTQHLFLQLHAAGLAYRAEAEVNWDPVDQTVLANEQVDANGRSWRSGAVAEKKMLEQWFVRISAFADDLLAALDQPPVRTGWPASVAQMQRNWIGKSEGALVRFAVVDAERHTLEAFTTRPETLFGATFVALAPGDARWPALGPRPLVAHPLVPGRLLPVVKADFVVDGYGTGTVMGVPAHDVRDAALAARLGLPAQQVIDDQGKLCNSAHFDGLPADGEGRRAITAELERLGMGEAKAEFRLRDWLVSRQRRWGAPVPMVHCEHCGHVPAKALPVLPEAPGQSIEEWRQCACPQCGRDGARKDGDTLDTFVDSSWYFARFCDAHNAHAPFAVDVAFSRIHMRAKQWMPVDVYVGGIEHAILHLLYARFIARFMHTQGQLASPEPFTRLLAQGMVLGRTYKDAGTGEYLEEWREGCAEVWEKMSKSKLNGVDPETVVDAHGADALRLTLLFAGPPDMEIKWTGDSAVQGSVRFMRRVWGLVARAGLHGADDAKVAEKRRGAVDACVASVTAHIAEDKFNVAIADMMKLCNTLSADEHVTLQRDDVATLLLLLAPFAPFFAQEAWTVLKGSLDSSGVHAQRWPAVAATSGVPFTVLVKGRKVLEGRQPCLAGEDDDAFARRVAIDSAATSGLARRVVRRPDGSVIVSYF